MPRRDTNGDDPRGARGDGERPDGTSPERISADRAADILARVHKIPAGFVRAYGDISPGAPRLAGLVLSATPDDPALPWWRVVRADGSLAKGDRQRARLEAEGVPFRGDRVEMGIARIP